MTDQNTSPNIADVLAKYDRVEALHRALWPANKASLLAALAGAQITFVVVTFDGYGDSGQVESIEAQKDETPIDLPPTLVDWQDAHYQDEALITSKIVLSDAIERLVYDCLHQTHWGWENNEGAFGEVSIDVAQGSVTLDYNERFESSEHTQHIL